MSPPPADSEPCAHVPTCAKPHRCHPKDVKHYLKCFTDEDWDEEVNRDDHSDDDSEHSEKRYTASGGGGGGGGREWGSGGGGREWGGGGGAFSNTSGGAARWERAPPPHGHSRP